MRGSARTMVFSVSGLVLLLGTAWLAREPETGDLQTHDAFARARLELMKAEKESEHGSPDPEGIVEQPETIGDLRDDPRGRRWQELIQLQDPSTGKIPAGIRNREIAFARSLASRPAQRSNQYSLSSWTARGVWNVGGRTRALALDASDGTARTMLAGAISGGIWRTVDEGQNWTLTTADIDLYGPTCLVQDTRVGRTATWYCGTGEFLGNSAATVGASYFGTGLWKSANGGLSWTPLASTAPGNPTQFDSGFDYVWNVAIDVSNTGQDELYAATIGGIQRSINGGQSWGYVRGALAEQMSYQTDVAVTPQGLVYAALDSDGPQKGIWRSADGQSFTNINPPQLPATYGRIVLGLARSNPDVLWALVAPKDQGTHKLFKYSAGGNSWVDRSSQLSGIPVAAENNSWTFDSQGGYDMVMTVKPNDENAVFIGGVHLIRSTDQFQTGGGRACIGGWLYPDPNQAPYQQHSDQHGLVFNPTNPNIAYSASDGGVWKTTNVMAPSVQWTSLNNGYLSTQFYHTAIDEGTPGSSVIVCGLQDNGCWTVHNNSPTTSWIDQFGGDGCYVHVADGASAGGNYYFSAQFSVVYRVALNTDGSTTPSFQRVDPASLTDQNVLFVNPTALDPSDTRRMYMASLNGLWRANNVTAISTGNPNQETDQGWVQVTSIPNEYVTAIAPSRNPSNTVYYAGFNLGTRTPKMYKITNASNAPANTTPTNITGTGFPDGYINCIAVDPSDANKVLIAFSNYSVASLFYTTNGGTSWTGVEGNLGGEEGPSVRSCLIMPAGGTTVFLAGTSIGLYSTSSLNGSNTNWTKEGPNEIRNLVVSWLVGRTSDGRVVAATHGGGAFQATLSGTSPSCATRSADVSGDNEVDVTDLTRIVNHIIGQQILSPDAQLCADVSDDGSIDIVDVVQTVQIILNERPVRQSESDLSALTWSRSWSANQLRVSLESSDLAALQVEVELAAGTRLSGAPIVEGLGADEIVWNTSGSRLVILAPPDLGLSPRSGTIGLTLDLVSTESGEVSSPISVRVLGVNRDGQAIPSFERETTNVESGLEILSLGPNPTRGSIELQYRSTAEAPVRATIHDASGRQIQSIEGAGRQGEHSLAWDGRDDSGRNVASGTYFVRVHSEGKTSTRSFQVIR